MLNSLRCTHSTVYGWRIIKLTNWQRFQLQLGNCGEIQIQVLFNVLLRESIVK